MEEFEPKKRNKVLTKEFIGKYAYVFVLALLLIGGITYGYTFFVQNRKIASGSITTAALTVNFTDRSISASSLSVPTTNQEGLSEYTKSLTITNTTSTDGVVKLTLTRTSGLNLTDMSYAIVVNGAIQEIGDVPSNGEILETAIMGNETINVELRLWPKTSYSGSTTTFVGEITPEIRYIGKTAVDSIDSPAGKYVNFNCNNGTCEKWQIVKVEDDRLVLTKQSDYTNATSRTNSERYDSTLGLYDDGNLITSTSTDGKNVYLAKTVKLTGGSGTLADPYELENVIFHEPDKKVIAVITYKDGTTTLGTQNVYYNETNYISRTMSDSAFLYWDDGTNNYNYGDTITTVTSDTDLNAIQTTLYMKIIQSVITPTNPIDFANISSSSNGEGLYILPGTENDTNPIYYYRGNINNNNVIFGDYCWQIVRTTDTGGIKMIYNGAVTENGETCNNTTASSRQLTSTEAFNSRTESLSDVGYMNNTRYPYVNNTPRSGAYFGTSVEYGEYDTNNPGTNVYRLADDGNGSVGTTLDANHHYTCNSKTASGICTQVRYYYYDSSPTSYYINLTGGESIEDAIYKMTGNGSNLTKQNNSGYVLNQNNSTIKGVIDTWFETNLTNIVDNTKTDYRPYLEDTVYCNDRSFKTTGSSNTYNQSGWNPNTSGTSGDGILTNYLYFGSNNRIWNGWYSTTNVPTVSCPNESDRFTVSGINGNGALTYPVGLLTADEIVMAGASGSSSTTNNTYYLYTGSFFWSMSPNYFYYSGARGFGNNTSLTEYKVNFSGGVRPVISLRSGINFESGGDGTPTNPYVVKYN